MTARVQAASASGRPVLLLYDTKAGHAGGRPVGKVVEDQSLQIAFLAGSSAWAVMDDEGTMAWFFEAFFVSVPSSSPSIWGGRSGAGSPSADGGRGRGLRRGSRVGAGRLQALLQLRRVLVPAVLRGRGGSFLLLGALPRPCHRGPADLCERCLRKRPPTRRRAGSPDRLRLGLRSPQSRVFDLPLRRAAASGFASSCCPCFR